MLTLNRITYYLLYLLLLSPILSFYTMNKFGFPFTRYFSFLLLIYGVIFLVISKKRIVIPRIVYLLLIFIFYVQIRIWINGKPGLFILFFGANTSAIILIILIYNTYFSDRFINITVLIIKITVVLSAIVSMIQVSNFSFMDANPAWVKWGGGDVLSGNLYLDRRLSIFGFTDLNELGLSYMPLASTLIGFLFLQKNRFKYFFLLLIGISAFLSNNRYVMVAFLIIAIQVVIVQKLRISILFKYLIFFAVFSIILMQGLKYFGYNLEDWYNQRLFSEGSIKETTRYKAIDNFLLFFPQKPLFGTRFMTEAIKNASESVGSSQIHVGYLSALVYHGIFGCFFLFGFWFILAKRLFKTARSTNFWGSFFAFTIFLVALGTLVAFHIFFYGIIFAIVFDKYYLDKLKAETGYPRNGKIDSTNEFP